MIQKGTWVLVLAVAIAAGCGQSSQPSGEVGKAEPVPLPEAKKHLLEKEPPGARSVLETRKQARDGDEVVLVGHVAGSKKPFVEGRASFSVLDLSIKSCPPDEGCPTPWDCCCFPPEEIQAATVPVRFVDGEGKTLRVGAREAFGIRELSVVVVKGVVVKGLARRDDKGNLTVVASGLYPRKDGE